VRNYDESAELFRYVWSHCYHLLTESEQKIDTALLVRAKIAAARNERLTEKLLTPRAFFGDPEVEAAVAEGYEGFRERTYQRLLADAEVQRLIKRCPQCRRIVATPRARQCLWCHYDWHNEPYYA
jgi:hypothetical protein